MLEVNAVNARYVASAVRREQYPAEKRKEIAFIGRSNVGKSSLLNSLTGTRKLAKVSGQPGKTQTINFFAVEAKIAEREKIPFYLVDLPGYGYAKVGKAMRAQWTRFIEEYFLTSENLQFVCQLIDIRHAPMASDIAMFQWLVKNHIPVLLVATKADKINKTTRQRNVAEIRKVLGIADLDVLPYSSLKNEGRSELLDAIAAALVE